LGVDLEAVQIETRQGTFTVHRARHRPDAWVVFRHGQLHRRLPNHIPYRAMALALSQVGCAALLCTTSAGVLDPTLPLNVPLLVSDLLTLDNRLPDGTPCTVWPHPHPGQAHLVIQDGLISTGLTEQIRGLVPNTPLGPGVIFGYSGGPRTKTPAENRMWAMMGAQVNSMTVGPEVILANELQIPCAVVAVGHKYSIPNAPALADHRAVATSLRDTQPALREIVEAFLDHGSPVRYANQLYRFEA